ncbi:MAG: glycosyltransferase [Bacteroidota bacterium]
MFWIALIIVALYASLIGMLTYGWLRLPRHASSPLQATPPVTILIPFRNEARQLPLLIEDLTRQQYPAAALQIMLINDHSTDKGPERAAKRTAPYSHVELLHLPHEQAGKKAALTYGLTHATGDYILTTDADCRMSPQWVATMVACQQQTKARIVCGPVAIAPTKNFWQRFEALEFMSLNASGAGAIGVKRPIMSNAANTLYVTKTFRDLQKALRQDLPSGDDIFLLLTQKRKRSRSIAFVRNTHALVTTAPQQSISSFFTQRKRWTSKSSHYHDTDILLVAISVALMNLALAGTLIGSLVHGSLIYVALFLYLSKTLIDLPLLAAAAPFYSAQKYLPALPLFQLLYPFYITFTVATGFFGKIRWKNRVYKKKK